MTINEPFRHCVTAHLNYQFVIFRLILVIILLLENVFGHNLEIEAVNEFIIVSHQVLS